MLLLLLKYFYFFSSWSCSNAPRNPPYFKLLIYRNKKNEGISKTKNICLKILEYYNIEYFCLLDDDVEIINETEIKQKYNDDTTEAVTLAFEKDRSHDRKIWLMNYNRDNIIKDDIKNVSIPTFINKEFN
jgi:hypothetical protein